jgi:PAS domain S-box-containing protein
MDLTERKQVEDQLKKQKEMFELVINSVPARIFWKDLNSVYLGCNRAFAEAVGLPTIEAVIGKNDYDLIWAAEAEKYITEDKQLISSGISKIRYDENYTTPDGKKVWWHSIKMPLNDNKG